MRRNISLPRTTSPDWSYALEQEQNRYRSALTKPKTKSPQNQDDLWITKLLLEHNLEKENIYRVSATHHAVSNKKSTDTPTSRKCVP